MKQSTGIKAAVAVVAVLVIGTVGAFKFLEKIDNGYVGVRYSISDSPADNPSEKRFGFYQRRQKNDDQHQI